VAADEFADFQPAPTSAAAAPADEFADFQPAPAPRAHTPSDDLPPDAAAAADKAGDQMIGAANILGTSVANTVLNIPHDVVNLARRITGHTESLTPPTEYVKLGEKGKQTVEDIANSPVGQDFAKAKTSLYKGLDVGPELLSRFGVDPNSPLGQYVSNLTQVPQDVATRTGEALNEAAPVAGAVGAAVRVGKYVGGIRGAPVTPTPEPVVPHPTKAGGFTADDLLKAPEETPPAAPAAPAAAPGPKTYPPTPSTDTEGGDLSFRHFSNLKDDVVTLDPEKYGTGTPGAEAKRIKAGAPKVVSAYGAATPDAAIEPDVRQNRTEYSVRVPKSEMYDLSADPQGFKDQVTNENGGIYNHSEAEQKIKDAGYTGYYLPNGNGGFKDQARFFKPVNANRVGAPASLAPASDAQGIVAGLKDLANKGKIKLGEAPDTGGLASTIDEDAEFNPNDQGPPPSNMTAGKGPFSILSAERGERTTTQNMEHTDKLDRQLTALGLPHEPTEGVYQGGGVEPGFAVSTNTPGARKAVEALAAQHEQESVLHVDADKNGTFKYTSGAKAGTEEPGGKFAMTTPEEAQQAPGFTRDNKGNHYILRQPTLTEKFADELESDPAGAEKRYDALPETNGGQIISTDVARELSSDYMANRTRSAEVHEPASAFVKKLYADRLKDPSVKTVDFMAGGTGAGKTSSLRSAPSDADVVYDTNMNTPASARAKIQGALDAGKQASVMYVYRDPVDALVNGALPRAMRQEKELGTGRTVPLEEHFRTHVGAAQTVQQLAQDYKDNPNVTFRAVDNSHGPGGAVPVELSQVPSIGDKDALWRNLNDALDKEHAEGRISDSVYQGFKQKGGNGAGTGGPANPGIGRRAEPNPPPAVAAPAEPLSFRRPPEEGATSGPLPVDEQAKREQILRQLPGLPEARTSAITGDTRATGSDFQTSKLNNAAGKRMAQVMDGERRALREGADALVEQTGGTSGMENSDLYNRGATIGKAPDAFNGYLKAETDKNYAEAAARLGDKPIPALTNFQNYLKSNKGEFLGTVEGKQLLEGVNQRMKDLGFTGANDTFNPPTVKQAEALRQSLGNFYQPRTGRFISDLKDALDSDVASAAGQDVFQRARALNTMRDQLLKKPKLMDQLITPADGVNGLNRSVPLENVPKTVTSAPVDQITHLVTTLKQMGKVNPELAASAADSLNEIRAQFMNEYRAAGNSAEGMWNAKAGSKYLQNNNAKLATVFSPEEMQQIKLHNDAASILKMDRSYPGASAQHHNFVVGGVLKGVEHLGGIAGAALGEIPGAVAGIGAQKVAGKIDNALLSKKVEARIHQLHPVQQAHDMAATGAAALQQQPEEENQ
jgi:Zeta toxin